MQIQTFVSPLQMALGWLNQMQFNLQVFQPEITVLYSSNIAVLGTIVNVRLLLWWPPVIHPNSNPRLPMHLTNINLYPHHVASLNVSLIPFHHLICKIQISMVISKSLALESRHVRLGAASWKSTFPLTVIRWIIWRVRETAGWSNSIQAAVCLSTLSRLMSLRTGLSLCVRGRGGAVMESASVGHTAPSSFSARFPSRPPLKWIVASWRGKPLYLTKSFRGELKNEKTHSFDC